MKLNLHLRSSHVLYSANLQFAFLNSFRDRLLKRVSGLCKRNLTDDEGFIIELFNLCTHLQNATTLTIIILRYINATACWEVWIEIKLLATQVADRCITDIVEVMWKNLG